MVDSRFSRQISPAALLGNYKSAGENIENVKALSWAKTSQESFLHEPWLLARFDIDFLKALFRFWFHSHSGRTTARFRSLRERASRLRRSRSRLEASLGWIKKNLSRWSMTFHYSPLSIYQNSNMTPRLLELWKIAILSQRDLWKNFHMAYRV